MKPRYYQLQIESVRVQFTLPFHCSQPLSPGSWPLGVMSCVQLWAQMSRKPSLGSSRARRGTSMVPAPRAMTLEAAGDPGPLECGNTLDMCPGCAGAWLCPQLCPRRISVQFLRTRPGLQVQRGCAAGDSDASVAISLAQTRLVAHPWARRPCLSRPRALFRTGSGDQQDEHGGTGAGRGGPLLHPPSC